MWLVVNKKELKHIISVLILTKFNFLKLIIKNIDRKIKNTNPNL